MKPIQTRDDLIELAIKFAPSTACANIMRKEGAVNLGGFKSADDKGGTYIVQVISRLTGKVWHICICATGLPAEYTAFYVTKVPWEMWQGRDYGMPGDIKPRLIDGDSPRAYNMLKLEALCPARPSV
jgi:hypothetical protein